MTQTKDNVQRANEFNTLFMGLNDKGQEAALTILRSLGFAQSVMSSQGTETNVIPQATGGVQYESEYDFGTVKA